MYATHLGVDPCTCENGHEQLPEWARPIAALDALFAGDVLEFLPELEDAAGELAAQFLECVRSDSRLRCADSEQRACAIYEIAIALGKLSTTCFDLPDAITLLDELCTTASLDGWFAGMVRDYLYLDCYGLSGIFADEDATPETQPITAVDEVEALLGGLSIQDALDSDRSGRIRQGRCLHSSVELDPKKNTFTCLTCRESGGPVEYLANLHGLDPKTQRAELAAAITADDSDLDETWHPVDLRPTLVGDVQSVVATVLRREDGQCLFYPGRVNGIHADSGIGKSWVCAVAAAQDLNAGHHVGWVDLEDPDATTIVERLRILGVADETILSGLHYWSPREHFTGAAVAMLIEAATEHAFTLLVIDSLGEAFGLEGINEDKDIEVGPWLRRVSRAVADAGPAVVQVDHATKARDNPLHSSGSKRKRAAITGASYLVEATKSLTREHGGRLQLTCAKDRHGHFTHGATVAIIDMAVDPDGGVSVKVWPPLSKDTAEDRLDAVARAAVSAAKDATEPMTQRRLIALMDIAVAATLKRSGIDEAVALGALKEENGPNRSKLYTFVHGFDEKPNGAKG